MPSPQQDLIITAKLKDLTLAVVKKLEGNFQNLEKELRKLQGTSESGGLRVKRAFEGAAVSVRSFAQSMLTAQQRAQAVGRAATQAGAGAGASFRKTGAEVRKLEAEVAKLNRRLQETGRATGRGAARASGSFRSLAVSVGRAAAAAAGFVSAAQAILVTLRALRSGVQDATAFGNAMSEVATLIDVAEVSVTKLREGVLNLALAQGQNEAIVAKGLYQAISAGVEAGAESLAFLEDASKLAIAGVATTSEAVDLLTSSINAFSEQNLESDRAANVLLKTVIKAKTRVDLLAGSLGRVLPVAASLGISFEELNAALAALTLGGLSTDEAATALRQTLVALLNPSAEAQGVIRELGLDIGRSAIESRGLISVLGDLRQVSQTNAEAISKLFGNIRAFIGVLSLTGGGAEKFREVMQFVSTDVDAVGEAFEKRISEPAFQVAAGLNAVRQGFLKVGETILKAVVGNITNLDDFNQALFDLRAAAESFKPIAFALAASITAVGAVLQFVVGVIRSAIRSIGLLQAAFQGLIGNTDRARQIFTSLREEHEADVRAFNLLSTATDNLAQGFLGVTFAANRATEGMDAFKRAAADQGRELSRFEENLIRLKTAAPDAALSAKDGFDKLSLAIVAAEDRIKDLRERATGVDVAGLQTIAEGGSVAAIAAIGRQAEELQRQIRETIEERNRLIEERASVSPAFGIFAERSAEELQSVVASIVGLKEEIRSLAPELVEQIPQFEAALRQIREQFSPSAFGEFDPAVGDAVFQKLRADADALKQVLSSTFDPRVRSQIEDAIDRIEDRIKRFSDVVAELELSGGAAFPEDFFEILGAEKLTRQQEDIERLLSLFPALAAAAKQLDEDRKAAADGANRQKEATEALIRVFDLEGNIISRRAGDDIKFIDAQEARLRVLRQLQLPLEQEIELIREEAELLKESLVLRLNAQQVTEAEAKAIVGLIEQLREEEEARARANAATKASNAVRQEAAREFEIRVAEVRAEIGALEGVERQIAEAQLRAQQEINALALQRLGATDAELAQLDRLALARQQQLENEIALILARSDAETKAARLAEQINNAALDLDIERLDPIERRIRLFLQEIEKLRELGLETGVAEEALRRFIETNDRLEARSRSFVGFFDGLKSGARTALSALTDLELQGRRVADNLIGELSGGLRGFFRNIASDSKSAKEAFRDFAQGILLSLVDVAAQMLVVIPIARALQAALGGGGAKIPFAIPTPFGPVFGQIPTRGAQGLVIPPGKKELRIETNERPGLVEAIVPTTKVGGGEMGRGVPLEIRPGLITDVPLKRLAGGNLGLSARGSLIEKIDRAAAEVARTESERSRLAASLERDVQGVSDVPRSHLLARSTLPSPAASPFLPDRQISLQGGAQSLTEGLGSSRGLFERSPAAPAASAVLGSGDITSQAPGSVINLNVAIQAVDAPSFLALAARDPQGLAQVVLQAARRDPTVKATFHGEGLAV